jgi:hypothetical protein
MLEHGYVVLQASQERAFYAIDGDRAHMNSPFIKPRTDQGASRGIAFAEQRRHRRIGEWLRMRFGKGKYRAG